MSSVPVAGDHFFEKRSHFDYGSSSSSCSRRSAGDRLTGRKPAKYLHFSLHLQRSGVGDCTGTQARANSTCVRCRDVGGGGEGGSAAGVWRLPQRCR